MPFSLLKPLFVAKAGNAMMTKSQDRSEVVAQIIKALGGQWHASDIARLIQGPESQNTP
tara:strand:+ start:1622 stop:1798 length:177 start_codon:yes stop_codon:yes gene_type:complete